MRVNENNQNKKKGELTILKESGLKKIKTETDKVNELLKNIPMNNINEINDII